MPTPPDQSPATTDELGRSCPYCQTEFAADEAIARCGDCRAAHHAECWEENEGCAIPGCASAPDPTAAQASVPADVGADQRLEISLDSSSADGLAVRRETLQAAPVGIPNASGPRGVRLALGLVAALVVAALLFVVLGGDDKERLGQVATKQADACPGRPEATAVEGSGLPEAPPDAAAADPAGASASEARPLVAGVRDQLARTTAAYLAAIRDGDQDAAFGCLAPRWQVGLASNNADTGQSWWWERQRWLRDGLRADPSQLQVIRGTWRVDGNLITTAQFELGSVPWSGEQACNPSSSVLWASRVRVGNQWVWGLEPSMPGQSSEKGQNRVERDRDASFYRSSCMGS